MYMLLALRVNLHRDKELLKSFDTIKNKSVCASQSKRGGQPLYEFTRFELGKRKRLENIETRPRGGGGGGAAPIPLLHTPSD